MTTSGKSVAKFILTKRHVKWGEERKTGDAHRRSQCHALKFTVSGAGQPCVFCVLVFDERVVFYSCNSWETRMKRNTQSMFSIVFCLNEIYFWLPKRGGKENVWDQLKTLRNWQQLILSSAVDKFPVDQPINTSTNCFSTIFNGWIFKNSCCSSQSWLFPHLTQTWSSPNVAQELWVA